MFRSKMAVRLVTAILDLNVDKVMVDMRPILALNVRANSRFCADFVAAV